MAFWNKNKDSEKAEEPSEENPSSSDEKKEKQGGWLNRLTEGLSKSSSKLGQGITDLVTKRKLDEEVLEELQDLLIMADLGPTTAQKLTEELAKTRFGKDVDDVEVRGALAESVAEILRPHATPLTIEKPEGGPFVILVCGVNGVGKTTTIGKMAQNFQVEAGHKVLLAAGDTFRAAASEQLKIWGERIGAPVYAKEEGADAASVAFEAYDQAKREGQDIVMVDTAGRLHNKANLMAELEKIIRVLKKQDENAPHAVLLVLDGTTGQNAHAQLETFQSLVNVTGLVVTKLDGSAKGGVVVALAEKFGLPIHAIGVGEQAKDLNPFDADDFAKALMGV